ncbi:MAG: type IX secretion system protein PorQ [Saprospiraceae bacterium]|nr:type IX secretion system protein PorQ [Saprospiraceae bacterium]
MRQFVHSYHYFLLWSLFFVQVFSTHAQVTGGQNVFKLLTLSPSARMTALGGTQITVKDDDVALAAANPAALNAGMDGRLTLNHNFFLKDIQHGYVAYAQHLQRIGFTIQGGVQYMNYGDIKQADEFGNVTGMVKASETTFTLGAARPLTDRLSLGLNLRFGVSTLDLYQSSMLSADAGFLYSDTAHLFSAGLVLRNAGVQLATYNGLREDLPLDLQLGFSKRLRYLPFRLTVIAHHLHEWDIRYDDPNAESDDVSLFGEETTKKGTPGLDNFFRHLIFNGEFLLGRNEGFRIRFGYNHLRRKELSVNNYRSLAGFSGGIGLKINRFRVDMGYGSYHLGGGVVHFSIGTNLKEFF